MASLSECDFTQDGAVFSADRRHRYALWRIWDHSTQPLMFIGFNPSDADESADDPTIRRVRKFAKEWGHGGILMTNLFSFVSSNPRDILTCTDPVLDNDKWLTEISSQCSRVVFAWGSFDVRGRDKIVVEMFPHAEALMINKDHTPRHPLYVPGTAQPIRFRVE